ncbi:NADP-dependent malic enzyme [Marinihelvus fidelis]|uniref:NADP-dependent malic enzyme n=1 Tax=Marinihelvus fidelis TaxID=2613842 RepID=A0A5N0T8F0_9GAMM|nr:NADP-dependent malic enzyme [Marinihelvus fidelis]KAA9130427.1 NADP-dependent malic enzyme [Marinihelvus fidelis]
MKDKLKEAALEYHRSPRPGKIKITPTKALTTSRDLALAYSPGVAAASELIAEDPAEAGNMTARSNLVGVVTNGTAVLGLGDIGPLAAKPVMEGKGVLFKKFADIDVFDIEIDERDPKKLIDIVASLGPTFGGINLEDIKAPECFEVEAALRERMNIPVFHDDQHGTAIIVAAAVTNALELVEKDIGEVKLAASGAGAAGMACLDLLVKLGMKRENITVSDKAGVVYEGRVEDMDPRKAQYATPTEKRTLAEILEGVDIFLGVSAGGIVTGEMIASMAERPIVLALANPVPEIMPDEVLAVRPDAIIATGRSDFPNQVNNVLCFPFIFRGALDVGATGINDEMQMACVNALAELTRKEVSPVSAAAYGEENLKFGPQYLIPKPFDPRLLVQLAPAVARAAIESGVATRPIENMEAYREKLEQFLWRTGILMKPIYDAARRDIKRIAFAEGEEEVILRAVQIILDDCVAKPVLIGRPSVIAQRVEKLGLRFDPESDVEIVNPEYDPRFREYWTLYHSLMERKGVSPVLAKAIVRTRNSVIAALSVKRGDADGLICGIVGRYQDKVERIRDVIGVQNGGDIMAALSVLGTEEGTYFVCDTQVNADPSAEEIVEITLMAAEKVRHFGLVPRVALLSHSSFGSHDDVQAQKMRRALDLLLERAPDLEVDGEMPADMAIDVEYRRRVFPNSRLKAPANLLVMPTLGAAHIAYNLARVVGNAVAVGPILLGTAQPAHILTPSATVRRVVNMTALAAVEAQLLESKQQEKDR